MILFIRPVSQTNKHAGGIMLNWAVFVPVWKEHS